MKMTRNDFLRYFSTLGLVVSSGTVTPLIAKSLIHKQDQVKFRFILASDAHYGQPDTPYEEMTETFINKANLFHSKFRCDFCILNGDIIHDEPKFMPLARDHFQKLDMPLHVAKGNHDRVTDTVWNKIWDKPVNYSFLIQDYRFTMVTTSDKEGTYLSPDLDWLEKQLGSSKDENVFLVVHIPQYKWTRHAIETPEFFEMVSKSENIKAVFHGHEHDQDGFYWKDNIPYIFDSHIGGSWGTNYKGFRVVEVLNNSEIVTYMMNPDEAMAKTSF